MVPVISHPYTSPVRVILVSFAVLESIFALKTIERVPGSPLAVSPILQSIVLSLFVIAEIGLTPEVRQPIGAGAHVNHTGKVDSKYIFVAHSSFTVTSTL